MSGTNPASTQPNRPEPNAPLEEALPPNIVATPSEVRQSAGEEISWWQPGWHDSVQYVGWRWLFLAPAIVLLAMLVGAFFFPPLRFILLIFGAKLLIFIGAVAMSLAAWVSRLAARARKEPFCIHCGYSLIGLPDNYRCPECGRPHTWRVIEEYRRDPLWFKKRYEMQRDLPAADVPFEAGAVRRKPRDGTA
jgi:predicted RNA-binding Zn-ribbon protein involved in translation (DUF1610 family)